MQPTPLPPPSDIGRSTPSAAAPATRSGLDGFFGKLQADQSGFLSLLVILVAGAVLSYVLWVPFAQPAKAITDALPDKNCATKLPGTNDMRTCAATVALWKMIGPLTIGVLVFLLRHRLAKLVAKVSSKVHAGAKPLLAPLLATLLFLLVWAGSHARTGDITGIFPQKAFPAIVGVYTFIVVRYGPALQRSMSRFFTARERTPMPLRVLVTISVPTIVSLLLTNQERVSRTAHKEQLVVLIGLTMAWLMLSPRGGDIAAAGRDLVAPVPTPVAPPRSAAALAPQPTVPPPARRPLPPPGGPT